MGAFILVILITIGSGEDFKSFEVQVERRLSIGMSQ